MQEIWKPINGYVNYEISNIGRVRSLDHVCIDTMGRVIHKKGQLLKIHVQIGADGYAQSMVEIYKDKKMHRLIVARLVAKAFIPNPDNPPQVNHKDENSLNNRVDNLEWCTAAYNVTYGGRSERGAKSKSRPVNVYNSEMKLIDTQPSGVAASIKYNVSRSSISDCCHNKRASVNGLFFQFCESDNVTC